jgi:pimeloyl-ACP methyl ester carboxylesterase
MLISRRLRYSSIVRSVPPFHAEVRGAGPRIVFVHGSVGAGANTWGAQRELAARFTLVILDRPGYPPNPPLDRIDFGEQARQLAELLEPGDHLVGHSYGGVIALLAADGRLGSLTVNEPPAFGLARGNAAVEEFLEAMERAPREPRAYLKHFLPLVGVSLDVRDRLSPAFEAATRAALVERPPHEAEIPLARLRELPFPKLVVSGAHSAALDAVADVLERELPAKRAVLPGAGHNVQRAPGYNEALTRLVEGA